MTPDPTASAQRRTRVLRLNARLRACRLCHLRGYLDEAESVPIAFDPPDDLTPPRVLLIGQAPGLRATIHDRPFVGAAGERLRGWLEQGGIPREDFHRKVYFSAVTRCYPGRLPGAKGDRVPSPDEQTHCRPWNEAVWNLLQPEIVLLVGLLAIRTHLGRVPSLSAAVGTATVRDGVRYLPLPHASGVSRRLNPPDNQAAVRRASEILREWVEELGIRHTLLCVMSMSGGCLTNRRDSPSIPPCYRLFSRSISRRKCPGAQRFMNHS